MLVAADAGADDVQDLGDTWQVTTPPTELHAVRTAIEEAGFKVKSADLTMIPTTVVELEPGEPGQVGAAARWTRSRTTTTSRPSTPTSTSPTRCSKRSAR